MESAAGSKASETCEARAERAAAKLRAGTTLRRGASPGRHGCSRPSYPGVARIEQAPPAGPEMVPRVEPGTDLGTVED